MSNVKYLYVRNEYKKRDITIVSDLDVSGDVATIRCGWSFRSNKEKQFLKKEGRKIALERMNSANSMYSVSFHMPKEDICFYKISSEILIRIYENENTPRKYLKDISEDLGYFIHFANGVKPSWDSFILDDER